MKIYLLYFLLVFLSYSCVTDISFNEEEKYKNVVLNCILTEKDTQYAELTHSNTLDEGAYFDFISDAQIILYSKGKEVGRFEKDNYRKWKLDYKIAPNTKYEIKAIINENKILYAETSTPKLFSIHKIAENQYSKTIRITDPLAKGDAYWCFVLGKSIEYEDQEKYIEKIWKPNIEETESLESEIGTHSNLVDDFNQEGNMSSLINNSTARSHRAYIRLADSEFDIQTADLDILATYNHYSFVVVRLGSIEYDKYMKSTLVKMLAYEAENDPTRHFEENKIFSNIENGYGIFAAYREKYLYYNASNIYLYE